MTLGETARVWVPSRLGYGIHGADPLIPPNTDLVFELKLVAVRNEFDVGGQGDDEPLDPQQIEHLNSRGMPQCTLCVLCYGESGERVYSLCALLGHCALQ